VNMKDWDDAYANMAHVADSAALPAHWAAEAAAYRASGVVVEEDIAYGDAPRQRLDLVWPDGTPEGLVVFVHGGYWMRLHKSDWTQFAEGARASGWTVAVPGYTLTPNARISGITCEIRAAVSYAAGRVAGPIRLVGHSAGGHLVSRMVCADMDIPLGDRIARVMSISGLHDLRPLMRTAMNDTLGLDLTEARAESPALLEPRAGTRLTAWVGGGERPEFIRQTQLIGLAWEGFDVETQVVVDSVHHHFSVIEGLRNEDSAILSALLAN